MQVQVLDLDGSIPIQSALVHRYQPKIHAMRHWGPRLRMGCGFGRFRAFERSVRKRLSQGTDEPALTLIGSGDFHHASLALVKRIQEPFNLLVVDNHPDWMRGLPVMHCGTWLYHAARLPMVQRIFHVGGNVDFDNGFRWLAPWRMIREGKINVLPSIRTYERGGWRNVVHEPVRPSPTTRSTQRRLERVVQPWTESLRRWPLYVSLDKDVMVQSDAVVNWDSGHLDLDEVQQILQLFTRKAGHRLAGMDIVGDWSPVRSEGLFRKFLHWTEHPPLQVQPADATERNEASNLVLLDTIMTSQAAAQRVGKALRIAA